jgi:hypothetical protein
MVAIPSLVVLGVVLLLLGFLMMYWASSRDLKDAAIGAVLRAAWTLVWKRQRPGIPGELTSRVDEVRAEGTHLGKAKVVRRDSRMVTSSCFAEARGHVRSHHPNSHWSTAPSW